MDIAEIVGYITVGFIIVYFAWMFAYEDKDADPNKVYYPGEEEEEEES